MCTGCSAARCGRTRGITDAPGAGAVAGAGRRPRRGAGSGAALDPARAGVLLENRDGPLPPLPDAGDWQRALAASQWVDQPTPEQPSAGDRPLVLENGLLYLRRYREYERRLALGLRRIGRQSTAFELNRNTNQILTAFANELQDTLSFQLVKCRREHQHVQQRSELMLSIVQLVSTYCTICRSKMVRLQVRQA